MRVYDTPKTREWDALTEKERQERYMEVRLALREMGFMDKSIIVYSFWPDAVMIKEIGDPVEVARYLGLDREGLSARIILAQGRQNTNYAITLYACHPFFVQGYTTMTNGENTACCPDPGISLIQGISGIRGIRVRFRGVHAHSSLCTQAVGTEAGDV